MPALVALSSDALLDLIGEALLDLTVEGLFGAGFGETLGFDSGGVGELAEELDDWLLFRSDMAMLSACFRSVVALSFSDLCFGGLPRPARAGNTGLVGSALL